MYTNIIDKIQYSIRPRNCLRVMIHINEVTNTNLSGSVNVYDCASSVTESQPTQEPLQVLEDQLFIHKKNTLHDKPCENDNHER
jgi:hypothetical protein